jgi:peptidoglycan/LPS O-acetylase OafA/YrhL
MVWQHIVAFVRDRFARVTQSVAYIPQIDGLRAVAMMMVLAHHLGAIYLETSHRLGTVSLPQDWDKLRTMSPIVPWLLNLAISVPIFCVISGFVLTIPFARNYMRNMDPPSFWIYLLRRLIRMEPPYVLSMTLFLIYTILPLNPHWHLMVMYHIYAPHYLASLAYLHAQIYAMPSWINGVAWTLEIEFQFYLILPLIARLFLIKQKTARRLILVALILAGAMVSQFVLPPLNNPRLDLSLLRQTHFFVAGVLLADIQLDPPKKWLIGPAVADGVSALMVALLVLVLHWIPQLAWTEPFLVAIFFFAVFRAKWFGGLLSSAWFTVPGSFAYSIYLYHYFIVQHIMPYTLKLFPPTHALGLDIAVQYVLILIPVMLVAAIMYLIAERPFVTLSHAVAKRFQPKKRIPAPVVAVREA